jgi:predicted NBD/HSP70 family sugar kinase
MTGYPSFSSLIGELAPVDVLSPLVAGPVIVDNDVHWAARAERQTAPPDTLDDFVYVSRRRTRLRHRRRR